MIGIGCDHGGYALKQEIIKYLEDKKLEYKDYGCFDESSVDYPVYAKKVAHAVADGECEKGILICGTGIGISITANKILEPSSAGIGNKFITPKFTEINEIKDKNGIIVEDVA